MKTTEIIRAWGRILAGRPPSISIEITKECPLSCPGCYAFGPNHLGSGRRLTEMRDFRGDELVQAVLRIVDRDRPLHLSLVGGEPLVRYREITTLLPELAARGVHTQVVTSAVRPIPEEWRSARKLNIVVSIDGLQPEHDARRKPATYDRIWRHIRGHSVTVHCTVTGQMAVRAGYVRRFVEHWSAEPGIRKIWISLFTPQQGEESPECLEPAARIRVIDELASLSCQFPKLEMPDGLLASYRRPPSGPGRCIFARTTRTFAADLAGTVKPCQLGGEPDCSQCGCVAAAALDAVGRHRLWGGIRVGAIYEGSEAVGRRVEALRQALARLRRKDATEARLAPGEAGAVEVRGGSRQPA